VVDMDGKKAEGCEVGKTSMEIIILIYLHARSDILKF
jgi:hypothetical protein